MLKQFKLASELLGLGLGLGGHEQQRGATTSSGTSSTTFDFRTLQKPFWILDKKDHLEAAELSEDQCCWNHIVGLPTKNNREYPLFDYEETLFNALMDDDYYSRNNYQARHLWVLKATGLGVTELMLRIMAWLCTSTTDNLYHNAQMVIVTGPNIDLAIGLMRRLKKIFYSKLGLIFDDKETVLNLNGCHIQA
jgi:hypothetical protein